MYSRLTIMKELPIGVFDSGVGGLTVLAALKKRLPNEKFLYLGDTARLPYGTKGDTTIRLYTQQVAELLCQHGIKLLVIACNTATSYGLAALQQSHPSLPVLGVVRPGAQKACELSKTGNIAILATEATIRSKAYEHAIHSFNPNAKIFNEACGLFIALVEEGFAQGPIADQVAATYLHSLFAKATECPIDTILLGCTHFPVLAPAIKANLPTNITVVDSAATTAQAVYNFLQENNLFNSKLLEDNTPGFWVTDSPERFARIGSRILEQSIKSEDVLLVDISPLELLSG